jgi:hypothetical protein
MWRTRRRNILRLKILNSAAAAAVCLGALLIAPPAVATAEPNVVAQAVWDSLGRPTTDSSANVASPTAAWTPDGARLDVFVYVFNFRDEGYIAQATYSGGSWHGWYRISAPAPAGFELNFAISATWSGTGRLDIFGVSEGHLVQKYWTASTGFVGWVDLGAPQRSGYLSVLESGVSAVWTRDGGRLDVFGKGPDNALWQTFWTASGGWRAWTSKGGNLTSAPAISWQQDYQRIDVFARGTDNAVWQRYWIDGVGWSRWTDMGGSIDGGLAASWGDNGRLLGIYGRGDNGSAWVDWYEGVWQGWLNVGGAIGSNGGNGNMVAVATIPTTRRIDLFGVGPDGVVVHRSWN